MQIGLGDPIGEEIEKIKKFWQSFKNFAATKKFVVLVSLLGVLVILIVVIAVIAQLPRKLMPPKPVITPTPITFPTPTPVVVFQPLSTEAANLSKELEGLIYDEPNLSFPNLDWKINLK